MALIFSAQRARFGFTLRDKQPKAGKTFWISSVMWTNTALSELRSPVLGSGEIWLQVVQTAWSWEELGFRFPWSWLVPAAGESGSSGCASSRVCDTTRCAPLFVWFYILVAKSSAQFANLHYPPDTDSAAGIHSLPSLLEPAVCESRGRTPPVLMHRGAPTISVRAAVGHMRCWRKHQSKRWVALPQ